jgi:hypothetical protein
MGVRVRLTSIFNLPQDHFDATRTARSRTQEAVVCRFGMARRDIGRKVLQMGDIFHFELLIQGGVLSKVISPLPLETVLQSGEEA